MSTMALRPLLLPLLLATLSVSAASAGSPDANRLTYLDEFSAPYYVHRDFPKLTTPQWIGQEEVDAAVILAIDDMRDVQRYEDFLRPILNRLKQIDGRAPLSIMTNQVDPAHPHLQHWVQEGVSLECHTYDHPCPLLQGGDFAKAQTTYDRCVDLLAAVPHSHPVAFRMPCCDSRNTPSPRFWAEIFNDTTGEGNFLALDSSVFHLFTPQDAALPQELTTRADGQERFRRYIPFPSFVNTIEDYPYPYVIGRLCWEFPCMVPSDWSAQHVQQPNNPETVTDLNRAIDATVLKQGVFDLVFHPHGWIRNDQIVELIDHTTQKHGAKVAFLSFRDAYERLNKHLLAGNPLRNAAGEDNGVRLLDLNDDGLLDVVIGNEQGRLTRLWSAESNSWSTVPFPVSIIVTGEGRHQQTGVRFGVLEGDVVCLLRSENQQGMWRFRDGRWHEVAQGLTGLSIEGRPVWTSRGGQDQGVRLRDLDGDDTCELLVSNPGTSAIFQWEPGEQQWNKLPIALPAGTTVVDDQGRDAGLRFVDVNQDGHSDILFSDHQGYALHLFHKLDEGWKPVSQGDRSDENAIPMIVRQGTNNGAWFHSGHLWVQNEDTDRLPDLVDRMSLETMLVARQPDAGPEASDEAALLPVGAAEVNITPNYPVRLSGYGNRRGESEGITLPIWAKAVAIGGDDGDGPALLINLENCSIPAELAAEVTQRLAEQFSIPRARVAICATHTHTAPHLTYWGAFLFGQPLPDEQQQHVDRYTRELTDHLVQVARDALTKREPGRLFWSQGTVPFAANRRTLQGGRSTGIGHYPSGPVDHSLPLLVAKNQAGELLAVVANYACHCTTLQGDHNQISGDWAGYAQQYIQENHPGAIAMVVIGCGADANPHPRGTVEFCQQHGRAVADEVNRLLALELKPLRPPLDCRFAEVELPLAALPTREQWEAKAQEQNAVGYHARHFLQMSDRGEALPTTISYPIGTWTFSDDLAMVFLGGEVVVDYAIRLKEQFAADRLWVTAYANAQPCYIASRRVLQEGGYEADSSMIYYGQPARLAPETEDLIIDTVQQLLPHRFYSAATQRDFPPPNTPAESLAAMTLHDGMQAEVVAAEPLVADPVAFDWGPDGRLWVVEMRDYPNGRAGQAGGRVKVLEDENGDGVYDRSHLFLDQLNFPTGIKVWRDGVIVTAAPEVFYAEDTDGDGQADLRQTLYQGFAEGNQQHRVNGLRWGLDNWLYLANGDSGGIVESLETGEKLDIRGRDLRIRPDQGLMEAQSGQTQFGRDRDDWGNWFGGNNSNPMWHYVLEDHYLRRNPQLAPPDVRHHISQQPGPAPVFPTSRTLERFNDFDRANRFTSACSPMIYRDELLGKDFIGNSFVCEPVHNLVHREVVQPSGVTFISRRAEDEQHSEFLASSDSWFRPTMVRTGPDGALWIADMYRFVIEHPQWIPADWQRRLDLQAGDTLGRIYRVFPKGKRPEGLPRLDRADLPALVTTLNSSNGWQRDMAQQMLLWEADHSVVVPLQTLLHDGRRATARLHALCTLDGLDALQERDILRGLRDEHPAVRRQAVRLSEPWLERSGPVAEQIVELVQDDNPQVRMQLVYSLGCWQDARSGELLATLALEHTQDDYLRTAILSSVQTDNLERMLHSVLEQTAGEVPPAELVAPLVTMALALGQNSVVQSVLDALLMQDDLPLAERSAVLAATLDVIRRQRQDMAGLLSSAMSQRLSQLLDQARAVAVDQQAALADRTAAVLLLGRQPDGAPDDVALLGSLMTTRQPPELQSAAVAALGELQRGQAPQILLADWRSHTPRLRDQILDLLLTRSQWTTELLDHIASGQVQPIDARRRQQLLDHTDQAIQARAKQLFDQASSDRKQVLQQYQQALELAGDAEQGRVLFNKHCATCHRLDQTGHQVGPDLTALVNSAPDVLLTAMLDPNQAVEDKYLDYIVATDDGRQLSGILSAETANSVTLTAADGKVHTLTRGGIEVLQTTGKSLMPEGIERDLTPQDVADLISYVRQAIRANP